MIVNAMITMENAVTMENIQNTTEMGTTMKQLISSVFLTQFMMKITTHPKLIPMTLMEPLVLVILFMGEIMAAMDMVETMAVMDMGETMVAMAMVEIITMVITMATILLKLNKERNLKS